MAISGQGTLRIVSNLLESEPDLRDIVLDFVAGLPRQIAGLRAACDALAWDELTLLSHRLKGSGGSYGYPDLSDAAARAEAAARLRDRDAVAAEINYLEQLVHAVQSGLLPDSHAGPQPI